MLLMLCCVLGVFVRGFPCFCGIGAFSWVLVLLCLCCCAVSVCWHVQLPCSCLYWSWCRCCAVVLVTLCCTLPYCGVCPLSSLHAAKPQRCEAFCWGVGLVQNFFFGTKRGGFGTKRGFRCKSRGCFIENGGFGCMSRGFFCTYQYTFHIRCKEYFKNLCNMGIAHCLNVKANPQSKDPEWVTLI